MQTHASRIDDDEFSVTVMVVVTEVPVVVETEGDEQATASSSVCAGLSADSYQSLDLSQPIVDG